MPAPGAWLVAFLITAAVEAPIVVALTRGAAARAPRRWALAVFAQLATHPLVWFVFPRLVGLTGRTSLLLSELWAWLAEAAFYALVFADLPRLRALGISALANGASLAVGVFAASLLHPGRSEPTFPGRTPVQIQGAAMTTRTAAKGTTQVTSYRPATYDAPPEGPRLNDVQLVETFTGDIDGEGRARVLQAQAADGSLRYCTIERVVGALAGRRGSFLLQVQGDVRRGHNHGVWFVLAGSGTGELRGLRGEGGFEAEHGKQGAWTLDYWFE